LSPLGGPEAGSGRRRPRLSAAFAGYAPAKSLALRCSDYLRVPATSQASLQTGHVGPPGTWSRVHL